MPDKAPLDDEARAARAALGLDADADLAAAEAAFRRRAAPLARAATRDPAASEALRGLIEARAILRGAPPRPAPPLQPASPAVDPPRDAPEIRPRGFALMPNGRDVAVTIALADLVAAAETGAVRAWLLAPVLRRCPSCAGGGRPSCGLCRGSGVEATGRERAAPLDLDALAQDRLTIEASPWSDAYGRGARGGPLMRARLV